MTLLHKTPRLTRFAAVIVLLYLVLFSTARLVFWQLFDNPNDPLSGKDLWQSLYLGLKYDLRLALLIVLPLLLLGWLKWIHPLESRFGRGLWQLYLTLATLAVTLFYLTDFGHFAYLHTRVDSTVLRFLENLAISLNMVWESYPVVSGGLLLAVALALMVWGLRRLTALYSQVDYQPTRGWRKVVLISGIGFLVLFGLYGKVSWYPLRWSDAFFSTHAFASAVAANPVHYFIDTYQNGGMPFDEEATRKHYAGIADYLGVDSPDEQTLQFARRVTPAHSPSQPYNVVVVILESFAAYKSGLSGNPLKPTPHFDEVARNGLYFRNFYTPTTGTARSIFAAVTGIPDVQLHETSSRNPTVVNQHVIIDDFSDYEKYYFLGGSASWGNIRGMLSNNIRGLHIYEEGSYESPRVDVWGISDLDLFKEAHKVLQHEKKPFFAVIQTSGNHRPYTIPERNEGFELRDASKEELDKYGFESVEEYNSYRFMDHSIGYFMQKVKEAGYFDNTVFAFFGDHGIAGNAGIHTHKADTQLHLGENRVPFVIYSPALIPQGKVMDTVASETDVMTSLASLTGHAHTNTTLGRDLFNPNYDKDRNAFIIAHGSRTTIGVVNQDYYFRMPLDGKGGNLYRLANEDPREDISAEMPEQAKRMRHLTRGLYETARYITNNNPRLNSKQTVAQTVE
jgi:phosphoglycerol transferase MdoB-like AlkP superfamily enzyme